MSLKKISVILVILIGILSLRIFQFYESIKPIRNGEHVEIATTLFDDPKTSGIFQKFNVVINGEKIFIRSERFPQFYYGQVLKISGKVEEVLLDDGKTIRTMQFPHIEARDSNYLKPLNWIRNNLIIFFSSSLDIASSGLLLGIVFGIRDQIPQNLMEALRDVGVLHITAASGMNVTIFAGAVVFGLTKIIRRQKAIAISFVVVWVYALLSGFDASIVRASIMATVSFGAGILGRQNTSIWALALTGFLMVMINPSLIQDIGFQLSFAATLGIIVFGAKGAEVRYDKNSKKEEVKDLISSDLKTTIAAQAATLPILFMAFGQVSALSILANVLILWAIPILMTIGSLGALVSFIIPQLGELIILFSLPLLRYIQFVVLYLGQFESMIKIENLSWMVSVGYYLVLFSLFLVLKEIRRLKIKRDKS